MKILLSFIALCLAYFTQASEIEKLLKNQQVSVSAFPDSFFWTANTTGPRGQPAAAIYRVDGFNNMVSIQLTFLDPGKTRYINRTQVWDIGRNISYLHSTVNNDCYKTNMTYTLPMRVNDFINAIYNAKAVVIDERDVHGHHLMTIEVPYDAANDVFFYVDNGDLTNIAGRFLGDHFDMNVTQGITPRTFTRQDHVPKACGF